MVNILKTSPNAARFIVVFNSALKRKFCTRKLPIVLEGV